MTCKSATQQSCSKGSRAITNKQKMLIALMLPQLMVVINLSIINVAIPAIRETFNAPADLMAWVITMYTLPYVALMPLYGRLGDEVGIRRMLILGGAVFLVGTAVNLLSRSLPLLLLGRFIQGLGASGTVPLAIAMICNAFSEQTRGHALGQWNSIGPVASVAGSLIGGFIIDTLGWRATFVVPIIAGLLAISMVRQAVPTSRERHQHIASLRDFDWIGVGLLSATLATLLFYINSRSVTGRDALTDWRLLLATLTLLVAFVWHERRRTEPFIDLSILAEGNFRRASIASALRMVVMSGFSFLTPLFLADVQGLNATVIGLIVTIRSAALFPTMYFGGRFTDRWGDRRPIALGLSIVSASILLIIVPSNGASVILVAVSLLLNGLGAGLALPALHHAAMSNADDDQGGAAAGLYSMIRFWGMMLGTAVSGVLLQFLFDRGTSLLTSYRIAFTYTIIMAMIGVMTASLIREEAV